MKTAKRFPIFDCRFSIARRVRRAGFLQSKIINRQSKTSSRPGLIVLVGLLVALVCLLFAGGPPGLPAAGFDLPAVDLPSKLVSAAPNALSFAWAEPQLGDELGGVLEDSPLGVDEKPAHELVPQAPGAPVLLPPPPEPAAPAFEVKRPAEPEKIETSTVDEQPGEIDMPAIGKKLTVQIVLWGWLLANAGQPAQAQEKSQPGKPEPGEAATRLDKIERQLGDLHTGLKSLKDLLEGVSKQLETYDLALRVQKNTRAIDQNSKDIVALREEIDRLQRELTKAQAALGRPTEPRKAMASPELLPTPRGPVAQAQSGQLELINDWLTPVSVWVDDLSYPLRPGERRLVAKPAGNFNYEVVGAGWGVIQPRRTTAVASGETLTIRVVPR